MTRSRAPDGVERLLRFRRLLGNSSNRARSAPLACSDLSDFCSSSSRSCKPFNATLNAAAAREFCDLRVVSRALRGQSRDAFLKLARLVSCVATAAARPASFFSVSASSAAFFVSSAMARFDLLELRRRGFDFVLLRAQ